MHREFRPDQMRLGAPSSPHGDDNHGHAHHRHGPSAHDHDPEAERRWLWAVTALVGLLLVTFVPWFTLALPRASGLIQ